jgi:hypothetical protein
VNILFKKQVLYSRLRISRDHAYGFEETARESWGLILERFVDRLNALERLFAIGFHLYCTILPITCSAFEWNHIYTIPGILSLVYLFLLGSTTIMNTAMLFSSDWLARTFILYHTIQMGFGYYMLFQYNNLLKIQIFSLLLVLCRFWHWQDSTEIHWFEEKSIEPLLEIETVKQSNVGYRSNSGRFDETISKDIQVSWVETVSVGRNLCCTLC